MRKTISIFYLCLIGQLSQAQSALSIAGNTYSDTEFSITWTIGESNINTYDNNGDFFLTQGFNQPLIICEPCDSTFATLKRMHPTTNTKPDYTIEYDNSLFVYPNPARDIIKVDVKVNLDDPGYLAIYSSNGIMMRLESLNGVRSEKIYRNIDVSEYRSGQYYIRIFNDRDSEIIRFEKL